MTELDGLFDGEPGDWLEALPGYQKVRARELAGPSGDYEGAAQRWLTAKPEHTASFGASTSPSIFKDKLWEELERFLCGDPAYEEQRRGLLEQKPVIRSYVVGVISAAIAPALGASGVFLAPAVALLLASIGKISLNAWCKARGESRRGSSPTSS